MYEFHADRKQYYDMQKINAEKHVLPFIEKVHSLPGQTTVLEIGCGEGGVMAPFLERGCRCVGVDFDKARIDLAASLLGQYIPSGQLRLLGKDIYQVDPLAEFGHKFDIIILKDVIEHIHDRPKLFLEMKRYLNAGGCIFFGFPPWQMPFGGHQQICKNKFLSRAPYYHLLPAFMYKSLLAHFHESVDELLEIRETRISIEGFERVAKMTGYRIEEKKLFLINPIYEYKFRIRPREQFGLLGQIPWLRNFFTTCAYYIISPAPPPGALLG